MERARIDEGDVVVCVGGGLMGTRAALAARQMGACVLVMDVSPSCMVRSSVDIVLDGLTEFDSGLSSSIQFVVCDGVEGLLSIMHTFTPKLVVPAVPGHMAAKLAMIHSRAKGVFLHPSGSVGQGLLRTLPQENVLVADTENGVLITSYMTPDGVCAEGCTQPVVCPITGFRKDVPMHELLRRSLVDAMDCARVLVSWQLDGAGGVMGDDVRAMLDEVELLRHGETYGVATSCVCHGIVNTFEVVRE